MRAILFYFSVISGLQDDNLLFNINKIIYLITSVGNYIDKLLFTNYLI